MALILFFALQDGGNQRPLLLLTGVLCGSRASIDPPSSDKYKHITHALEENPLPDLDLHIHDLCDQIKKEQDNDRLIGLVRDLNDVLDESRKRNDKVVRISDLICPSCGSKYLHLSRRHNVLERTLLSILRARPYRCDDCDKRFYSRKRLTAVQN